MVPLISSLWGAVPNATVAPIGLSGTYAVVHLQHVHRKHGASTTTRRLLSLAHQYYPSRVKTTHLHEEYTESTLPAAFGSAPREALRGRGGTQR